MKRFIFLIILLCFVTTQSFAVACYTSSQYRAEQAIRYHTRMMVFGLYCKAVMRQDTYGPYESFTSRNQNVIRKEENLLISYYRQNGNAAPETTFHSLRTNLANKTSLQASQSIISFCQQNFADYSHEKSMKPSDFERWIDQINVKSAKTSTHALCSAAKSGQ
jgi:hypothetical protein